MVTRTSCYTYISNIHCIFIYLFIYLREREREREGGRGREGEREKHTYIVHRRYHLFRNLYIFLFLFFQISLEKALLSLMLSTEMHIFLGFAWHIAMPFAYTLIRMICANSTCDIDGWHGVLFRGVSDL